MKCSEVQQLLHMELDAAEFPDAVRVHLERCQPCQQVQQDLLAMKAALQEAPPPALPMGFELELRRRLSQEAQGMQPQRARRTRWVPAVVAMAATVLLVLGGLVLWRTGGDKPGQPSVAPSAVAMTTVSYHRIHLAVHAEQAHAEALFDVQLPGSASLAGGLQSELGDGQVVRWRSDILPGINEIDLPVVLRQETPKPVQVRARLIASGKVYTSDLKLVPVASGRLEVERAVKLAWVLAPRSSSGRVQ